jgi:hypothetical protein
LTKRSWDFQTGSKDTIESVTLSTGFTLETGNLAGYEHDFTNLVNVAYAPPLA